MHLARKHILLGSLIFLFLLAGCGVKAGSSANQPTENSPTGAPEPSATPLSPTSTPKPSSTPSPPSPAVTLQVGASEYAIGSTISVTIKNQSQQTILLTDHQTNCTVLLVERQVAGIWQPVALCKLMIVTRVHPLNAGGTSEVKLTATSTQWPAGTYQATLNYQVGLPISPGAIHTVSSSEFHVG